jgi:hypothetical protein
VAEERVRPSLAVAVGRVVRRGPPECAQDQREQRREVLEDGPREPLVEAVQPGRERPGAALGLGAPDPAQDIVQARQGDLGERGDQAFFLKRSARRAPRRS